MQGSPWTPSRRMQSDYPSWWTSAASEVRSTRSETTKRCEYLPFLSSSPILTSMTASSSTTEALSSCSISFWLSREAMFDFLAMNCFMAVRGVAGEGMGKGGGGGFLSPLREPKTTCDGRESDSGERSESPLVHRIFKYARPCQLVASLLTLCLEGDDGVDWLELGAGGGGWIGARGAGGGRVDGACGRAPLCRVASMACRIIC